MTEHCDVAILGGGIGGYSAAIRLSQLGKKVVLVEKEKLGGTCLHKGCIPSKALLRSAEVYSTMLDSDQFGVETATVTLNFAKVQERKRSVVDELYSGLQSLIKSHNIRVMNGNGRILGPTIFAPKSGTIGVEKEDGEVETIISDHLIIATGSRPKTLPGVEVDGTYIMTSDEALQMDKLPTSIMIIGGGVIGIEWASMLADFGVKVTLVEYEKQLLAQEDEEISRELERLLKKRGITMIKGAGLITESISIQKDQVHVRLEQDNQQTDLKADKMLIAVGRQANLEQYGLENTGVKVEKGCIKVNSFFQTAESHIYAIGDVIGGLQLAHAASYEGIAAAEHLAGHHPHLHPSHMIPRCVYSRPEVASTGWTEREAKQQGLDIVTVKVHFRAMGKAHVLGQTDGFIKVVVDQKNNDIIGVHMIGPQVTDYISEAMLAQLLNATPWEVATAIHPHPTLSEAIGDVMNMVHSRLQID